MTEDASQIKLTVLEPSGEEKSAAPFTPPPIHSVNSHLLLYGRWVLNTLVLAIGDGIALGIGLLMAGGLRAYFKGEPMLPEWSWFLLGVWWISSIGIHLLPGWGIGPVEELRRTVLLLVGVFAATTTALFLAKISTATSRMTLTLSILFSLPILLIIRSMGKRLLARLNLWGMPAVIYGNVENASLVLDTIRDDPDMGYIPVAIIDETRKGDTAQFEGLPVLPAKDAGSVYANAAIFAMQGISRHQMLEILEGPLSVYRHVVVIPDLLEAPSLWVKPRDIGGVLGLEISSNLLDLWARMIKRTVDIFVVLLLAPIWVTLCLLIAFLIWVHDRHNPVFIHDRAGIRGKPFRIWKFRTMRHDAETFLEQHLDQDEELRIEWETNFKLRKDPRITPIGQFLRRLSLDELPQLVNVLKGEMSLVGPRPLPEYHNRELPMRTRRMRERVKPGMTGLWQVSGRSASGNTGIEKWDTYYVRNWSLWLDIVILLRTFRAVMQREGAY